MTTDLILKEFLAAHRLGVIDSMCSLEEFIGTYQLYPHLTESSFPKIYSVLSLHQKQLIISFFIEKTDATYTLKPSKIIAQQADFLWEESCIELFFTENNHGNYIEINATADGRYNIYEFSDYRTPNTLPPTRTHRYQFDWLNTSEHKHDSRYYHHQFMLTRTDNQPLLAHQVNPTAILYLNTAKNSVLYYATKHTQPPDFHQSDVWKKLKNTNK